MIRCRWHPWWVQLERWFLLKSQVEARVLGQLPWVPLVPCWRYWVLAGSRAGNSLPGAERASEGSMGPRTCPAFWGSSCVSVSWGCWELCEQSSMPLFPKGFTGSRKSTLPPQNIYILYWKYKQCFQWCCYKENRCLVTYSNNYVVMKIRRLPESFWILEASGREINVSYLFTKV